MMSEYPRLRATMLRDQVVKAILALLKANNCEVKCGRIQKLTLEPFLGLSMSEYEEQYCMRLST